MIQLKVLKNYFHMKDFKNISIATFRMMYCRILSELLQIKC